MKTIIFFLIFCLFVLSSCVLSNNPLASGKSDFSENHRPGEPNPPAAVTDLSVSAGASQAILSWSKISSAQSYVIKFRKQSFGEFQHAGTTTTPPYIFNNLENNVTYEFLVESVNQNGQTSSPQVSATPLPIPGNFSLTAISSGNHEATLSWSLSAGATSYKVNYGSNASLLDHEVSPVMTPLTVTGLTPGQTYYFSVAALNSSGSTIANNVLSITILSSPSAPTLLSMSPGVTQITLSWSAATGASSYDLEYGTTSSNLNQTVTGVSSPYVLTGLSNGQIIYARVVAINSAG